MKLRDLKLLRNIRGKKVLLRVDFNVPFYRNTIAPGDDTRIRMALPTIQYILKNGAKVIIITHLGRPKGKQKKYCLDQVAKRLSFLLKKHVIKLDGIVGKEIQDCVHAALPKSVIMLENIRFDAREEENDLQFSKMLSGLGDYYVNEAFSNSHRNHASMVGITKFLPSYAGFLLQREVSVLSTLWDHPKRPLTLIMGGAKISTKLGLIKKFLNYSNYILLGGALANTVLHAKGIAIGKSLIERDMVQYVKNVRLTDTKIHIPLDVVVAKKISNSTKSFVKAVGKVLNNEYILDIGPDTISLFNSIIQKSKTIIWNGPMGMIEYKQFSYGTKKILKKMLQTKAKIFIGGGESLKALQGIPVKKMAHIYASTGGGAMLEYLEKRMLPAIQPLVLKK